MARFLLLIIGTISIAFFLNLIEHSIAYQCNNAYTSVATFYSDEYESGERRDSDEYNGDDDSNDAFDSW